MTTQAQRDANRKNALCSTGPRTPAGKAAASRNSLRFGIYSEMPAVPGLERAEEWDEFRSGVVANLAPMGTLEEALAERVAVCLWRLRRTVWFETAVTAAGLELVEERFRPKESKPESPTNSFLEREVPPEEELAKLEEELEKKKDTIAMWDRSADVLEQMSETEDDATIDGDDVFGVFEDINADLPDEEYFSFEDTAFVAGLGVPKDEISNVYEWNGWTPAMVRKGIEQIAKKYAIAPGNLTARAVKVRRETQEDAREEIATKERKVKELRRLIRERRDRMLRGQILPDGDALHKVARYEAHLSRQMTQALHELQRLQATRAGQSVPPPAALDVTVSGDRDAATETQTD